MKIIYFLIVSILLVSCIYQPPNDNTNYHSRNNRIHSDDTTLFPPIDTIGDDSNDYSLQYIGKLRTFTTEDWDYWQLYLYDSIQGWFRTFTTEDWDYWEFNYDTLNGKIRTFITEDWDYWEIFSQNYYKLRTFTTDEWDYWEIYNNSGLYLYARTFTDNDFDYWEIYNDSVYFKIQTFTTEDYDYWEIYADTNYVSMPDLAPVCFIAIFTSSIYQQGNYQ